MKRILLALCALVFISLLPSAASATTCSGGTPANTCYWIGGTGTWDNSSTSHWSFTSGGSTCSCLPSATTDKIIFDASSGGGTVTADTTISGSTFASLTAGAFTGTLAFNINNPSLTFSTMSFTGSGTRSINCGTGTFTLTGTSATVWDNGTVTNETLTCNAGTIDIAGTGISNRVFSGGSSQAYGTLKITNPSSNAYEVRLTASGSSFVNWTFNANARNVRLASQTMTVSGTWTWDCATGAACSLTSDGNGVVSTVSVGGANTLSWLAIQNLTKSGAGSITVNNGLDIGGSTSVTINQPSSGGSGGKVIGG